MFKYENRIITPKFLLVITILMLIAIFCLAVINSTYGKEVNDNSTNGQLKDGVVVAVDGGDDSYTKIISKSSKNVVLSVELSPANDPHIDKVRQIWVNIKLRYKEDDSPIPYKKIYIKVGKEIITLKTNKNGNVNYYMYKPLSSGKKKFTFSFKGSKFFKNGKSIYLHPIIAKSSYYLAKGESYYSDIDYNWKTREVKKYKIVSLSVVNYGYGKASRTFTINLKKYKKLKVSHFKHNKSTIKYNKKTKILKVYFKIPRYKSEKSIGRLKIYLKK